VITSFTRHQRWARTVAVAALALQAGAAGVSAPLWAQTVPPISDTRGQRDDPRRAEVASRTEGARRALRRDEMEARKAMRTELLAGDNANETRVAELLEQMPRLERRRIELLEQEQRELARFLTPLQRARYFALQDELRRGMQELQRRRLGDGDTVRNGPPGAEQRMRRRPPGGGW
jgi:Spy/CpxP family protein refolding chaperone